LVQCQLLYDPERVREKGWGRVCKSERGRNRAEIREGGKRDLPDLQRKGNRRLKFLVL